LALVGAIVCIAGIVFWIESEDSSSASSAANLEPKSSQERDRASVVIGGLTAARQCENVALTEVESKRIANSKPTESKQGETETRSEALARELSKTKQHADARQMELREALDSSENTVLLLEREIAAQKQAYAEQKQTADAEQKELKQALDNSEKRALALEHKLTSAREAIASAEKPSNAEVTVRDAASPTGLLNRPMERSNEITGSTPTPQGKANVTVGVQTSSDASPYDVTAGAPGRLTRSNRSEPGRPQSPRAMSSAEEAKLIARAESLIKQFDFANARLFLANAWEKGSARAAFMMAETYDRQILRSLQAYGVRGDAQKAREFYQVAAAAGIEKARERAEALQSDANFDTRAGGEDSAIGHSRGVAN
jgi:hypothetical protein